MAGYGKLRYPTFVTIVQSTDAGDSWSVFDRLKPPAPDLPTRAATAPAPRASSGPSKNQRRQAERLEREIEQAEAGLKALEEQLADPGAWSSPDRSAKSSRRHEAAKRRLKDLYEQWEAAAGAGTERIVP